MAPPGNAWNGLMPDTTGRPGRRVPSFTESARERGSAGESASPTWYITQPASTDPTSTTARFTSSALSKSTPSSTAISSPATAATAT